MFSRATLPLKAYFESKLNVTLASRMLFIHRTTFIDRLTKIQELANIDLNDYRECLYLMISIHILDL